MASPTTEIAAATAAAKEDKKEGKFVIPLPEHDAAAGPDFDLKNRAVARTDHENLARAQQPRRRVG